MIWRSADLARLAGRRGRPDQRERVLLPVAVEVANDRGEELVPRRSDELDPVELPRGRASGGDERGLGAGTRAGIRGGERELAAVDRPSVGARVVDRVGDVRMVLLARATAPGARQEEQRHRRRALPMRAEGGSMRGGAFHGSFRLTMDNARGAWELSARASVVVRAPPSPRASRRTPHRARCVRGGVRAAEPGARPGQ